VCAGSKREKPESYSSGAHVPPFLENMLKRILQIGNWPPPVCGWSMSLVGLRRELESRGWDCQVMNLNENRKVPSDEYIDVQNGWDYVRKVLRLMSRGYAVHVRVNGETRKGYLLALAALVLVRLYGRPALLTYCGGHQQSYFPAPRTSFRHLAFALLFRIPSRIYCNSEAVKRSLLTTGINPGRVAPIPHFSTHYVEFKPVTVPLYVEEFCRNHDGVFFLYVCFRKEYMLDLLAHVIRCFRVSFPRIGFLVVGTSNRELQPLKEYCKESGLNDAVCVTGSLPHDLFLTLMKRSLAYIRIPLTDGVCSSVLEALALRIPVLASDNGARPPGAELWRAENPERLLELMAEAAARQDAMIARIPTVTAEDNAGRLADDIEQVCGVPVDGSRNSSTGSFPTVASSSNTELNEAPATVSSVRDQGLQ
jgi:glycosyltransferase involved in cell wall biosynthesis